MTNMSPAARFCAELFKMVCDADAFAFGANVPKGFSQHVKQKPAGEMYVEYSVYCLRQGHACVELIMSWSYFVIY